MFEKNCRGASHMLELKDIKKNYLAGSSIVHALKGVSLQFRESEFCAILGPSGCGKTTLLNIVGGLDHYTSGDLLVENISTSRFEDSDWDAYRNSEIGFVFQNYNLISHLTVLDNVEMALQLTGMKKAERNQLAMKALEKVDMLSQIKKKPNELSGGQMQRVAIARAIVNNPSIILADEPTGALDSELSVQVMDILKEISKDKLVIMVTHNRELAEQYCNRIVKFKDGEIEYDTNPYVVEKLQDNEELSALNESPIGKEVEQTICKEVELDNEQKNDKTQLSENNKIESGNVGVFGVENQSIHENLNAGVESENQDDFQSKNNCDCNEDLSKKTSTSNSSLKKSRCKKIKKNKKHFFTSTSMNFGMAFELSMKNLGKQKRRTFLTSFAGAIGIISIALVLAISNGFQLYMDNMNKNVFANQPIGFYEYNMDYTVMMDLFMGGVTVSKGEYPTDGNLGFVDNSSNINFVDAMMGELMKSVTINDLSLKFTEYVKNIDKSILGAVNVVYGTKMHIVSKTLNKDGLETYVDASESMKLPATGAATIATNVMGSNGQESAYWQQIAGDEDFVKLNYDVIEGKFPQNKNEIVLVVDSNNKIDPKALLNFGIDVYKRDANGKIVIENGDFALKDNLKLSDIVSQKLQLVHNDDYFKKVEDNLYDKVDAKIAYENSNNLELEIVGVMRKKPGSTVPNVGNCLCYTSMLGQYAMQKAGQSEVSLAQKALIDRNIFSSVIVGEDIGKDEYLDSNITSFLTNRLNRKAFLKGLGIDQTPTFINVYPANYEGKKQFSSMIQTWNNENPTKKVAYFDATQMLMYNVQTSMSMVTTLLLVIASISLVVSCIMIAVITSNSVIERTREIGILRSLGARKVDITRVFVAETSIIGMASGILGVILAYALSPLGSLIIKKLTNVPNLMVVNPLHALGLIALSLALTVLSGLIPAISASKKNVVDCLRQN